MDELPGNRIKRLVFAAFVAVLSAASVRADDGPKPIQSSEKCMMWKATSATATVYLVGSMHLAKPEMYPLPKEMEDAFAKADTLVVEININKVDQEKLAEIIKAKGMYAGDETLSKSLKPETLAKLKAACGSLGLPEAGLEKMKPWMVGVAVQMIAAQKLELDPALGVDKHFLDLADKRKLPVEELETAEFQLNLLADFDAKDQEQSLAKELEKVSEMKAELNQMVDEWIAGDAAGLDKQVNDADDGTPTADTQKLIYDRNGPMAAKVEKYLKGNKTVFVVVGCAHLVGDNGIVKTLLDDKIAVEQSPATRAAK